MRNLKAEIATLLLLLAVTVWAANTPIVQQLLPGSNEVKDFKTLSGSLVYGKGNDLTKIYDGGYELYTKNGVVDAARQMYQRKNDYMEVTTHTMKSIKAAQDFLVYWQKQNKVKSLTKTKTSTGFIVTKPSVMSYFVVSKYFVTVQAFHTGDKAVQDVKSFNSVIEKKILNVTKPKK